MGVGHKSSNGRVDKKPEYHYHKPSDRVMVEGGADNPCCSLSQLKFSLYLFNILFFVSGIILVSIGLYTFLEKHPSLILLTSGLYDVSACILIFSGTIYIQSQCRWTILNSTTNADEVG